MKKCVNNCGHGPRHLFAPKACTEKQGLVTAGSFLNESLRESADELNVVQMLALLFASKGSAVPCYANSHILMKPQTEYEVAALSNSACIRNSLSNLSSGDIMSSVPAAVVVHVRLCRLLAEAWNVCGQKLTKKHASHN